MYFFYAEPKKKSNQFSLERKLHVNKTWTDGADFSKKKGIHFS